MEPAFLRINSSTIRWELTHFSGVPGLGTYQLRLTLEWSPTKYDELERARVLLAGDLEVSLTQDAPKPLAQLQPLYAVAFADNTQGTSARIDLRANVYPGQLEMLERERSGGGVKLHFRLQGGLFRTARPNDPDDSGGISAVFWQDLVYRLRPSDWLEVLEHWKYAKGFLIQVPSLTAPESSPAIKARDELELAIAHMSEGRYRDAVAACRDALELAYDSDDKDRHPEMGYKAPGIESADKTARFWLARRGLWAITHAAKHRDEVTDTIQWERRDAHAVIVMLSALLEHDPPV
jgi:hypothetical protein